MGNSGGASALQMLMASPELERDTFDKVIISSGMIRFGPHQNLIATQLVSERVNVSLMFEL
jgi:carboxylesterase type B